MKKKFGYLIIFTCMLLLNGDFIFSMQAEDSHSKKANQASLNEENNCPICFEELKHHLISLKCGNKGKSPHRFHIRCLKKLIENSTMGVTCPLCRKALTDFERSYIRDYSGVPLSEVLFDNNGKLIPLNRPGAQDQTASYISKPATNNVYRRSNRNNDPYIVVPDPNVTIDDNDLRNARPARPVQPDSDGDSQEEDGDDPLDSLFRELNNRRTGRANWDNRDDRNNRYEQRYSNNNRDGRGDDDYYQVPVSGYSFAHQSTRFQEDTGRLYSRVDQDDQNYNMPAPGGPPPPKNNDWTLFLEGLNGLGFGFLLKKELFRENNSDDDKTSRFLSLLAAFCGTNVLLYKINPERLKRSSTYKSMFMGILLGFLVSSSESKNK